jgi:phosphomannomutase
MLSVLAAARRQVTTLGALQAQLPARYTFSERLQSYPTDQSQTLLARLQDGTLEDVLTRTSAMFGQLVGNATAFDTTDGLRITFDGGDIIHLRPSGNAPELRCYTESRTPERAASLAGAVLEMIRAS